MSSVVAAAAGSFGRISLLAIDRPVVPHAHPHCHALFKVGGADSWFAVGGALHPLVAGRAVLVNAWQLHGYPYPAELPPALILALYIEPCWIASLDRRFGAAAGRSFFPQAGVALAPDEGRVVVSMAEELQGATPDSGRTVELLEAVVLSLAHRHGGEVAGREGIADWRIRKAVALLCEDPTGTLSIDEISGRVLLSRSHFFAAFKAATGIPPLVMRNALRMEAAYQGLLNIQPPIGEISSDLGFGATPHFSRFFREHHGVSPGAWRQAALRLPQLMVRPKSRG